MSSAGSSFVGTLWSIVASVRSGLRTRRFERRRPSKACGLVTSCTRCRSTYRRSGSPPARRTTCRSQTFSLRVLLMRKVSSLREAIECPAKPPHASVIGIDREGVARNERDPLLQRDVEQRPRTHVPRQAHPEVKAALGIVPGDARPGKLAGERGATSVLLLAVELAQPSDVRFG